MLRRRACAATSACRCTKSTLCASTGPMYSQTLSPRSVFLACACLTPPQRCCLGLLLQVKESCKAHDLACDPDAKSALTVCGSLQCEAGVTPNPDLACNRHIKFGALLEHCKSLGADMVATGHYARVQRCANSGQLQLLRGVDPLKDQSYFLASIHGSCLAGETPPSTYLAQGPCCSWLPLTVKHSYQQPA